MTTTKAGCVPDTGCSFARVFLTFSAIYAVGTGLAMLLVPELTVQLIRITLFENFEASPEICQLLGCLLMGWGAGKAAAVLTGTDEAITMFCTLNLVPMTIAVVSTLVVVDHPFSSWTRLPFRTSQPPAGKPWLFVILLLCYLYCAVRGPRREKATSSWFAGRAFLTFSACCITANGLCILMAPKVIASAAEGLDAVETDSTLSLLLGACALGWACGKWSCLYNGDKSIHCFCQINLLPMLASIVVTAAQQNACLCAMYVCFSLCYLFLALSGPPIAEDDDEEAQLPRVLSGAGRYGHMNSKKPDTSKLPYLAQRRPSFEFVGNMLEGERKGSKDSHQGPSLIEPLIDAEPVRQVSSGSSSGKFAGLSRIPSKEAAAQSKQPIAPAQRPAFAFLKT